MNKSNPKLISPKVAVKAIEEDGSIHRVFIGHIGVDPIFSKVRTFLEDLSVDTVVIEKLEQ